ncbi:S-layer protein domain-containing protein [Methanohalophilus portucalensis]|uniref:S-layer family duplication domain-containing protein n=2 Tax=Methanohalophilus portucalensis TaxID=39664 RepID=A0A1L9C5P6_9EURY|nr:S-layer protein domain-containing protein [Methanohalophilus portucalensis]ATU08453.1 S-layer protein [Methanohalophilus portucalensis]OJH49801.1 S-layer-related duplication domain protein [Methanohalophilus portucalensis FDF-1]RNI13380.1 S-layer protein [Methanohalophilus portucalensis FDF-1]SMH33724.1 S-layer family duplication domain-containing protein [Methanohalophilus portucalensis FDF-1]
MKTGFKILLIGLMIIGMFSGVAIGSPSIIDSNPSSSTSSEYGDSIQFDVTLNETANVTWQIDGTNLTPINESVMSASYTNSTASVGNYTVTAIAENMNGSDSVSWTWKVSNTPSLEDRTPSNNDVDTTTGDSETFSVKIDQTVNVTWQIDGTNLTPINESVTSASYTNSTASAGTYIVTAFFENVNGSNSTSWTWEVSDPPAPSLESRTPSSNDVDTTTGDSETFSVDIDQTVNVTWQIDGTNITPINESVMSALYTNSTASAGTYIVTAFFENVNGSNSTSWTWEVSNPPAPSLEDRTPSNNDVDTSTGDSETFSVDIDQTVNVTWQIDGTNITPINESVTSASYTNSTASAGNYTVTAFFENVNGSNSTSWNWEVHSATYEWGNRIWDEDADQSNIYTWDGRSFSGFYYDLDTGDTSETMEITIDVGNSEIKNGNLNYTTNPIPKDFEQDRWGSYQIIGFMAERYFAGYKDTSSSIVDNDLSLMSDGILSKVLLDTDDDESIYSGSSLTLEEGYNLNIQQVDVNGDSVWISLTQNGDEVDDAILSSDETYVYEKDLGGVDDVPVIAVHIDDVFSGTETNAVFIDGIFQISDDYVEIDEGDDFGEMEIDNVGANEIKMLNEDDIDLEEGDIIDIMGKLKFIVADDEDGTLRFAPFVDMSEPGTYELRGTIAEDQEFTWTPLNFEGFYYNIDEGLSSESLKVEDDDGSIDEGKLIYEAKPVSVEFEYDNSGWGEYHVIGFMAEKYFAGYNGSNFAGENYNSDLMSEGQLSKVLIDDDDEKSVYTGSSLILEEGYALNIQEVDVNGERVMIELTQDGDEVDSGIISSNDEYVYEKDLGDEDDVPIIVVHFNEVFSGTETSAVFVEGIFQISEDYLEVEDGDDFGVMTVDSTTGSIILENEDEVDLDEGDTIDIMGEVKFKVADDGDYVRYYPFVEVETEPAESLDIDIEPTTVVEGEEITFTVTSRGASIRDASILIDGDRVGTTSDEGVFEYDTDDAGKFTATAEKEGYVSSKGNFEVISPDDESKKISIEVSPEEVFEGTPITISVVKAIGSEPLEDAEVFFDGTSLGETDEDGTITYNPKEPGTHKLEAKADGYLDAELNIKVNELAANFEFSNLRIDPLPATAGEEFTVMVDSINTGNAEGSYTVELSINDNVTDSQEITLGQNNSTTIEFTSTAGEPGTYLVKAGGLSTTMDVEEGTSIVWYVLGGLLLVVGGGAAYIFATGGTAKFAEIAESLRSMLGR